MLNSRFTWNVLKTVQVMPLYNNMYICFSGCPAQGPLSLKFSLLFLWHIITKHYGTTESCGKHPKMDKWSSTQWETKQKILEMRKCWTQSSLLLVATEINVYHKRQREISRVVSLIKEWSHTGPERSHEDHVFCVLCMALIWSIWHVKFYYIFKVLTYCIRGKH